MAQRKRSKTSLIAEQYVIKYGPTVSTDALSRMLHRDMPELFKTARTGEELIRNIRRGHTRAKTKDGYRQDIPKSAWDKGTFKMELPESYEREKEIVLLNHKKIGVLSDIHFPYQNNRAIRAAVEYLYNEDVDCIYLNGDTIDFATISRHERNSRHRDISEEFSATLGFLRELRRIFPDKDIYWKDGNHDIRLERYLYLRAPEIFGDPEYHLSVRLRFGELGIKYVNSLSPAKVGDLLIFHGHEFLGSGGVYPARSLFLKTISSILTGHYHKTSVYRDSTMLGEDIIVNTTGCLCGLSPEYMPVNKWNHGFAIVDHDLLSGKSSVRNFVINKQGVVKNY